MIGLADFIADHRGAVERDLLAETGYELDDVGRSLSWGALKSFLSRIKPGSALEYELDPDMAKWSTTLKTNEILADICDLLSVISAQLRVISSHKRGKKPEPYKRPWLKDSNNQKIGKGALSITDMREWIKNRQKAG